MSDVDFFKTRMGRHFFDKTMPDLVRELERLNNVLELLVRDTRECGQDVRSRRAAND